MNDFFTHKMDTPTNTYHVLTISTNRWLKRQHYNLSTLFSSRLIISLCITFQALATDLETKVTGYLKSYMIKILIWKTSFVTSNQNLWLCRNFVLMSSSSLHAWKIIWSPMGHIQNCDITKQSLVTFDYIITPTQHQNKHTVPLIRTRKKS